MNNEGGRDFMTDKGGRDFVTNKGGIIELMLLYNQAWYVSNLDHLNHKLTFNIIFLKNFNIDH